MSHYDTFIQAIHDKKIVNLRFDSYEKWIIERKCIPFDFWPSRRNITPNPDRFHFYDLNSPDGKHNLSIVPDQVIQLEILDEDFDPANYVKWTPNWFIERDWGIYS